MTHTLLHFNHYNNIIHNFLFSLDNFAQGNLVQRQVYKLISDNMTLHSDKPTLISNGFKALRFMSLPGNE